MELRSAAIVCATRPSGETAAIGRFLTPAHGIIAGYVAGARGRNLRPVLIPGNLVEIELRSRNDAQLPFARVELVLKSSGKLGSAPLTEIRRDGLRGTAAEHRPRLDG